MIYFNIEIGREKMKRSMKRRVIQKYRIIQKYRNIEI